MKMNQIDNKKIQNIFKYAALGIEFGSMVLAAAFIGNYADRYFISKPLFTIIGIFTGFASGIYRLYKISKTFDKIDKNK